ncbi:hypothetical protein [Haloparvum sp. AD34]
MGTRQRERRRLIGEYTISNHGEGSLKLSISSDLDGTDFPNEAGTAVNVELVESEGEEPKLEIYESPGNGED